MNKIKEPQYAAVVEKELNPRHGSYSMIVSPRREVSYDEDSDAEREYVTGMNRLCDGDIEGAKAHLEQSYKMGYLNAANTLAYGYSAGWFGNRDYDMFIRIIKQLVRKKHPSAMNNYGFAYEQGIGVKQSDHLSLFWYKKAAAAGDKDAKANLGITYIFGDEAKRKPSAGVRLSFEAADLGQEMAMNTLGICYEKGILVTRNPEKAFEWYKKAYENGCGSTSELNLARCYEKGMGVERDIEKAAYYRQQAREHGLNNDKESYFNDNHYICNAIMSYYEK